MPRVLIAEDDIMFGEALKRALEVEGYAVDWVKSGADVVACVKAEDFDLILLDWRMPEMSGSDALKQLRSNGLATPVLMLTARDALCDRVVGLDLGADDYLVKPFAMSELFARMRALQRRSKGRATVLLKAGDIEIDTACKEARRNGEALNLSAQEYSLLSVLAENAGRYCSKALLHNAIYSWERSVQSNTLEVLISRLRKALGKDRIRTKRGLGYKLVENE